MKRRYIVILSILVLLVIGFSYAYFTGTIENIGGSLSVNSGKVSFTIDEEKVNANNLVPIYTEDYETEGYKHVFTITRDSNSTLDACYELNLVIEEIGTNLRNEYVHYKLEYDEVSTEGTFDGKTNGDSITLITNQSSNNTNSEREYTLYIWLEYSDSVDQTSILTGNASSRTLSSHLEVSGSIGSCISDDIPLTAYTLNNNETDIEYNTLYSNLGTKYEASVSCVNGSVYTYSNGSIALEHLEVPDYCTINFTDKEYTVTGESNNDSYGTVSSSSISYNGTATLTVNPKVGYYLASALCTNQYSVSVQTGVNEYNSQSATISNNGNTSNASCVFTFSPRTFTVSGEAIGSGTVTNSNVTYGETTTVTVSPSTGYYLSAGTCTNGYAITGMNIGRSYTSPQTLTINNNNQTENTTCTFTFSILTYEVGLSISGGTTSSTNPQTINYGSNTTFNIVADTGYNLAGAEASGCTLSESNTIATVSNVTSNSTCTVTIPLQTYTVNYNANNGSGAPSSQTKTYGVDLTLSSTRPTRSLYNFKGWNSSSSATTPTYQPGGSYTNDEGTTLYAVWEQPTMTKNNSYTTDSLYEGQIYYYKFVPTSTNTYVFQSMLNTGDSYGYLYNSSGELITSDDDSGNNSNFKISYSLTSGTTYYYGVKWTNTSNTGSIPVKIGETYTVSYNACSGTGAPSSQTKVYSEDLTLSSTTPTYTGHTFSGWSTTSCSGSVNYSASDTYSANSGTTLYAIYRADTYTISASANYTSRGTVSNLSSSSISYGGTVTVKVTPKTGYYLSSYTCTGNYTTNASTGTSAIGEQTVTISNGNHTNGSACTFNFTARSFTVTFNKNTTDTVTNLSPTSKSVTYASTYGTLPSPSRTGYSFDGWFTSGGVQKTSSTTVSITSNETLYAHWTAKTYTVTGSSNNTNYGTVTASNTVSYAGTTTLTVSPSTGYYLSAGSCDTNGYTITNMATGDNATGRGSQTVTINNNSTDDDTTCNFTFAARTFTVTFNSNTTDTVTNLTPTSKSVTYASTYGTLPSPSRTGYDFDGWWTDAGGGTQITASSTVNLTDNQDLYAHWNFVATVTFAVNTKTSEFSEKYEFDYTGAVQTLTVPYTGNYTLEVWGAEGGYGYTSASSYPAGKGGYSVGTVNLTAGTNLYVYVGGQGNSGTSTSSVKAGGFNGGGTSGYYRAGSGGGATDIRIGNDSLYYRVITAGGGGGAAYYSNYYGGAGGGELGEDSAGYNTTYNAKGGTISAGGTAGGYSGYLGTSGTFGQGGAANDASTTNNYRRSGGGGGGWYGGGGGGYRSSSSYYYFGTSGGGGGSGWVYTASNFSTWSSANSTDASNYKLTSSYYLTNASTISGNDSNGFDSPTGSNEVGHTGNGYARITYAGTRTENLGTISKTTSTISTGQSVSLTVTPNTGYYLSSGSCNASGYTITNMTTGENATSAQTITITNSSASSNAECSFDFAVDSRNVSSVMAVNSQGSRTGFSTLPTGGVYQTSDTIDGSTVYYYAGGTDVNNWVVFGTCINSNYLCDEGDYLYWRIIRTNTISEGGGIRLLYTGSGPSSNAISISSDHHESAFLTTYHAVRIGTGSYVDGYSSYQYPSYSGYWRGTKSLVNVGRENTTISVIAQTIDNWFNSQFSSSSEYYELINKDAIYCNDRSGFTRTSAYSAGTWYFNGYKRVTQNLAPSLNCPTDSNYSDWFTYSDSSIGNKVMQSPAALLTADELLFAGCDSCIDWTILCASGSRCVTSWAAYGDSYSYGSFFTMTPYNYRYIYPNSEDGDDEAFLSFYEKNLSSGAITSGISQPTTKGQSGKLIRPVISIVDNARALTGGDGSIENPYVFE